MSNKIFKDMLGTLNEGKDAPTASLLKDGAFRSEPSGFIPTGIEEIDKYVLGCGGLPLGRISEVYGAPGAGKSSFVYSCLAQCQRMGGIPVLIHTEEAAQKKRLVDTFGVDPANLLLVEPRHMEGVVEAVQKVLGPLLKSRAKDKPPVLVAWDSLAATKVKDHDEAASKEGPAARARILNAALRVLPQIVAEVQGHFMIVNQNRQKIGVMFGSDKTQPGGQAPKYVSTFRLELTYVGKVGAADHPTGIEVKFFAQKNKMAPPMRKLVSRLDFREGWTDWGIGKLAKDLKLITRADPKKGREALEAIMWDPDAPTRKATAPAVDEAWEEGEE